ncbi:MAG: sn-glycerol-3-phosphate ABC transporter ATP-binding protein UgpC [Candidatus Cloacimonetes bacterium]|nr:sn-glycerol-3-phosphate ABC transporter ATP-binding protein UgpC [Candidatus Cloacimonadota bacterium]
MAQVILKKVNKVYDKKVHVVKDISLEIKDKEFMVLVGPSGCGKSTILRMIAGLEEITSGEIIIGDRVVNELTPKDRDIAMVFQNYALYPHMSVYENMAYGLKLRKMPKADIDEQVQKTAAILGLEEFLDRKPKQLSGGQRQRVALGRAIVRKPQVFLFDEPLSNLDAKLRMQMRAEINKLHQQLDTTIIYVTHDQVEAMTMGDRITVLHNGIIQQCDTPLNLYDHPRNLFVAGFIGSPAMNMIKGKITNDNGLTFSTTGIKFPVPQQLQDKMKAFAGKEVILGVRPENVNIDQGSEITANVEVVEPMGNEIIVYLAIGDNHFLMRMEERVPLKPGDKVNITFQDTHQHYFDAASEECINYSL